MHRFPHREGRAAGRVPPFETPPCGGSSRCGHAQLSMHSIQDLCTIRHCRAELRPIEAGTNEMRTFMKRRRFLVQASTTLGLATAATVGLAPGPAPAEA